MKIISKQSVILASFTTLLVLMSANTHAKIYKWTDANGQVHYTAQPPAQSKKRIKVTDIEAEIKSKAGKYRPSKTASTTTTAATDDAQSSTTDETKSEEKISGPDKQLVKYCKGQKNNIAQLRKNFRNVWIDSTGKKSKLSQEQRKEKITKIQNQMKEHCSEVKVSTNS